MCESSRRLHAIDAASRDGCSPQDLNELTAPEEAAVLQAINDTGGTPASATLSAVQRAAEVDLRVPRGSLKAKTSAIAEVMKEVMQLKELPCVKAPVRVRIIASPPRHRRDACVTLLAPAS